MAETLTKLPIPRKTLEDNDRALHEMFEQDRKAGGVDEEAFNELIEYQRRAHEASRHIEVRGTDKATSIKVHIGEKAIPKSVLAEHSATWIDQEQQK